MKLPPRRLVPALLVGVILAGQGVAGLVSLFLEGKDQHTRLAAAADLDTTEQRIEAMFGSRKGLFAALDGLLAENAVVIHVPRESGVELVPLLVNLLWPRRYLDLEMAVSLLDQSTDGPPTFVLDLAPTGSEESWHRLGPQILAIEGAEVWQVERR